jgi:acid phosphatase (class A)
VIQTSNFNPLRLVPEVSERPFRRILALALVLADLFPEKQEAIIAEARAIGWHRVEIARHNQTDIYAGRMLAQAIVREIKASPYFQRDFAEAKTEVAASQTTAKNQPETR